MKKNTGTYPQTGTHAARTDAYAQVMHLLPLCYSSDLGQIKNTIVLIQALRQCYRPETKPIQLYL